MGINQYLKKRFFCCLLTAIGVACGSFAYEVAVGGATVWSGGSVAVPVTLDDTTDVSSIQFQINYDPQLLTLVSITNAPSTLGSAFTLDYENDDGLLVVRLYREDSLLHGSGELVSLEFTAKPGVEVNMESALTLADVGLGDQNGKDLSWDSPVVAAHGALRVSPPASADSDGDGLPDWWEAQYYGGLTNAVASAMAANGINTVLDAYVAGIDPTKPDAGFWVGQLEPHVLNWPAVSGRVYSVYWTSNLLHDFTLLESNILWSTGCYTDETYNAEDCGFYKIDVRLEGDE